jgi:hypothetical protein
MSKRPPKRLPLPEDDALITCVPFIPYRCPHCLRFKPDTYAVRGRMRYHRCLACGRKYKSWEIGSDSIGDTWKPPPTPDDVPPGGS